MLIKGIFTDVEVNNQPPDFARHLKNVLLTEKLGTPINEPGFSVCVPASALPPVSLDQREVTGTAIDGYDTAFLEVPKNTDTDTIQEGDQLTLTGFGEDGIYTVKSKVNNHPNWEIEFTSIWGANFGSTGTASWYVGGSTPYAVIGVKVIDEAIILWSTDGTNSEIGIVENCLYSSILNDSDFVGQRLGFSLSAPADAEHYINFNGERIVAWITDTNEPRIINIDNVNVQELNDIRIFPFSNSPTLTYNLQNSGGGLEAGAHQIVVAYTNRNGLQTNWGTPEKPIAITNDATTVTETSYDGVEPGFITSKGILINFTDIDTRFDFIKLGVIKTINNIATAQFIKEVPITGAAFTTIYTGTEGTIVDITLDEVLVPSASYTNAKAIGQVNNKLYLANLTVDEDIDLTEVALNATLQWEANYLDGLASSLDSNSKTSLNDTTFMAGEVYAMYLVGEKLDGSLTKAFHIPGRDVDTNIPALAATRVTSPVNTFDKGVNSAAATAKFTDPPLNYEVGSSIGLTVVNGDVITGEFGYWENQNENYPGSQSVITEVQKTGQSYSVSTQFDSTLRIVIADSTSVPFVPAETFLEAFAIGSDSIITLDGNFYLMQNKVDNGTYVTFTLSNTNIGVSGLYSLENVDTADIWSGEFTIDSVVGINPSYFILLDYPLGSTLAEFPVVNDSVNLSGFTQGNGDYQVLAVDIIAGQTQPGAQLKLTLNTSPSVPPLGTGIVTYTTTTAINSLWPAGNVRHHRFPTVADLHRLAPSNFPAVGKETFPILRVKANNVILTPEHQLKLAKWFIVYAKRTPASATVMGQAPYTYAGLEEETYSTAPIGGIGKEFVSTVANFAVGNTHNTNWPSTGEKTGHAFANRFIHQEVLKFNCFDLIASNPSMGSLYIRNEVKLANPNAFVEKNVGDVTSLASGLYRNEDNDEAATDSRGRWIFNNMATDYNISATNDNQLLREISQYTYLPANIVDGSALGLGADLRVGEDCLYLKVRGGHPTESLSNFSILPPTGIDAGIPALDIDISFRVEGYNTDPGPNNNEDTYLSTLCQRKEDVYLPFTEQPLIVTTNKTDKDITTGVFAGGDSKINLVGIKTGAPYAAEYSQEVDGAPDKFKQFYTSPTAFGECLMGIRYFGCYSLKNTGLRYTVNTDESTLYFPKVLDFYNGVFDVTNAGQLRTIKYSDDFTLANEYNSISVFNPVTIPAATFLPHTIVSSVTQNLEERTISWQTFLSADRYVMPRDKGPIINLQGIANDRLFIHQRDSLFITRSTTRLKGDIIDVTLGSGNMFDVVPAEVLSTDEGFGGTQHKFACKLTKVGYSFPDVAQGKVFLHNGTQLDEISKKGQRIFWRDNVRTDLADNPFLGEGITIAYDEKYNRLLVGVRDGINSFTASYSPVTQAWLGYHDYFPEYLIQTRKKLYSLKNEVVTPGYGGIFEHNDIINGKFGIYYNVVEAVPVPYPMLIDIIQNPVPYEKKVFGAVEWASEVIQANGIQAKDETIDYITISNNTKTTGRVELERLVNLSQIHDSNTRNVNEFWYFNALRDVAVLGIPFRLDFYDDFAIIDANLNYNKPWYSKAKFIDRFMITRFEYSNLSNSAFSFLNHRINYRQFYR